MRARVLTWADRTTDAARLGPGDGFYVSVNDGDEHGLLAGPFDQVEEALGMIERAQTVAEAVDSKAAQYTYGVCRAPTRDPGLLNDRLGLSISG
ncbi:MAG: hypothetical protein JO287_02220 [Pseudonocardiales bacterium]|nr:hypothetical protein [Pseudonocardiales bacterium]